MKILLADDDDFVRNALSTMLKTANHEVTLCVNGENAIDTLKKETFDVVITDLLMPEKDGVAVIDFIQRENINVPVLAISAGDNDNPDEYLAYASYFADDIMEKPVKKENLLAAIENLAKNGGSNNMLW